MDLKSMFFSIFLYRGNNNNNGNNMNMVMFTPMNGRRSLYMKKRDTKIICNGPEAELSQVAMEGIRFFIKFENNRDMNIQKYYETQILAKFDSEVLRLIMKHIIKGVTTTLLKNSNDDSGHL